MADQDRLKELSPEELLWELRRREAIANRGEIGAGSKAIEGLQQAQTDEIVEELIARQKVIYGVDDRQDLFAVSNAAVLQDADGAVALFDASDVVDNGNGTSTLQTTNYGTTYNLCASEPFRTQPTGAFCSGFLVASNVVATAGHCVDTGSLASVRFVFGFRMANANTANTVLSNGNIYRGVELLGRILASNGADWSVVRLDRAVLNHRITRVRFGGRIANNQAIHVIGHPSGLPTKYAPGANVRDNGPAAFFIANLDTYGGNSGSPVFDAQTHLVEGVLVRGENDYVFQGACRVSLVCPATGCRGEDCTRTTEFASIVPGYRTGFARHSRQVLDVQGASTAAGARLIQWPFHGGDNQRLRPEPLGDGFHRIIVNHSGRVLDVEGGSGASGARLIQWDWHGGDNQRFSLDPVGDGYFRVVAKHSGKVLDVQGGSGSAGTQIIQWDWHGGNNQRWKLEAVPVFARHSGQALDVRGASTAAGADLIQWPYHGNDNQLFRVEPLGDGHCRIVAEHSGRVLDVQGASTAAGVKLIQWNWHGGDNQRFRVEPLGEGLCRVVAKHSGRVLDVEGASTAGGARIIQWDWHGGNNQRWRLNVR
jgi:Ricin-type beta-trefoil lectin domain-like/Trypsin-like peptidase domain